MLLTTNTGHLVVVHGQEPRPDAFARVSTGRRHWTEAKHGQGDAPRLLAILRGRGPRLRGPVRRRRHNRQPAQLCPRPLRPGLEHPGAHHLHHAVVRHQGLSASAGQHQAEGHRARQCQLADVWCCGSHDVAGVGSRGFGLFLCFFTCAVQLADQDSNHQRLGDVINGWRKQDLELEPLNASMGPGINSYLRIPHTYCWSPSLVSKPADWGPEIGEPPSLLTYALLVFFLR